MEESQWYQWLLVPFSRVTLMRPLARRCVAVGAVRSEPSLCDCSSGGSYLRHVVC